MSDVYVVYAVCVCLSQRANTYYYYVPVLFCWVAVRQKCTTFVQRWRDGRMEETSASVLCMVGIRGIVWYVRGVCVCRAVWHVYSVFVYSLCFRAIYLRRNTTYVMCWCCCTHTTSAFRVLFVDPIWFGYLKMPMKKCASCVVFGRFLSLSISLVVYAHRKYAVNYGMCICRVVWDLFEARRHVASQNRDK